MVGSNRLSSRIVFLYIPLALFTIFLLFPFYWMLIISLKPNSLLLNTRVNPLYLTEFTLRHYRYLFENTDFPRWAWNTAVVTFGATLLSLTCSILMGYALGRFRFKGGNLMGTAVFLAYLIPPTLLFIPLSQVVVRFGIYNEYWALILTYPTFLIPFASWLLMGYFRTIPRELEECAMIDGASRIQAMRRIILPLALPGVLSAAIFSFTLSWNEFLYALVFMGSGHMKTIPVGTVNDLIRADVFQWGPLMAAAVLGSVPVAVVYTFFVDHYVSGMTAGAVKG